jgi:hypothetical protein
MYSNANSVPAIINYEWIMNEGDMFLPKRRLTFQRATRRYILQDRTLHNGCNTLIRNFVSRFEPETSPIRDRSAERSVRWWHCGEITTWGSDSVFRCFFLEEALERLTTEFGHFRVFQISTYAHDRPSTIDLSIDMSRICNHKIFICQIKTVHRVSCLHQGISRNMHILNVNWRN